MEQIKLDREEQDLLTSFEAGEWQSVENLAEEIERYGQLARANLEKDRRVSTTLFPMNLKAIQERQPNTTTRLRIELDVSCDVIDVQRDYVAGDSQLCQGQAADRTPVEEEWPVTAEQSEVR